MPENNSQPFLLNPQTGRKYYGKALGIRDDSEELWTDRPYESGYDISNPYLGRIGKVAGLAAGYGLLRSSPWLWEQTTQVARVMEDTFLPYKWGRTFQISSIMSHREAAVLKAQAGKGTYFPLTNDTGTASYLSKHGTKSFTPETLLKEGVTFKEGKLYLGKDTTSKKAQIVGEHVGVIRTQEGGNVALGKSLCNNFCV